MMRMTKWQNECLGIMLGKRRNRMTMLAKWLWKSLQNALMSMKAIERKRKERKKGQGVFSLWHNEWG
jgi:hypothetical protein